MRVQSLRQLYAVFVMPGLASVAVLYEAAFRIIATLDPSRLNNALLAVTIGDTLAGAAVCVVGFDVATIARPVVLAVR